MNKSQAMKGILTLVACLVASAQTYARTMVYVSNADDGEIAVYELNKSSGELVSKQKIAAGENVMPLTLSPNKQRLYAAVRANPYTVVSFSIDPQNGLLTRLSQAKVENDICFLQTDVSGNYLISSSYGKSAITISPINNSGEVMTDNAKTYPTGLNAHASLIDPTNRFLFVTNLGSDQIVQLQFDEKTGEAKSNDPELVKTQHGLGPRHLRFSPDHKFVYVTNEYGGSVNVYAYNKKHGTLQEKQSILMATDAFTEKPSAAEIQISPNGRFVYASERRTNTLALFKRNAKKGTLTFVESVATENKPRSFAISPDGGYLLSAGQKSAHLGMYKIDKKSGKLHFIQRYAVGNNPSWVEIVEYR